MATIVGPMLFGLPLAFPQHLDARLSIRRCNPVVVGCTPTVTERYFWRRLMVLKSGTCRSRPASLNRLCAMPIAWRRAKLNKPLIVKQN